MTPPFGFHNANPLAGSRDYGLKVTAVACGRQLIQKLSLSTKGQEKTENLTTLKCLVLSHSERN